MDPNTECIDYAELARLARQHRPRLIVAGATAYPRRIDFAALRQIADEVGAYLMADVAHIAGLVVADLHPDPVPHADVVTSTTHKTLRGPRGGIILCTAQHGPAVDKSVFPGIQGGPLMHVIAGKAVALKLAMEPDFQEYQQRVLVNARVLAGALQEEGLRIVSGGTDNHLMLVDLSPTGVTGRDAERLLDAAGITVNKNVIPFDQQSPFVTSGIRLGTPAVTTRGFGEGEMRSIAHMIAQVVREPQDLLVHRHVADQVAELCAAFPVLVGGP